MKKNIMIYLLKKINTKNIKVGCISFPNEFWNISPVNLKIVNKKN